MELIIAIASFAFVTSITPGPNNIMLTASGANFGFIRSLPHIAGIAVGLSLLNLGIGLGLGSIFQQFPVFQHVLKIVGSAYLLWLAFKMFNFRYADEDTTETSKPFSFLQAMSFQVINPKAWMMVISANASFSLTGDSYWVSVGFIILLYGLICPPSIMFWTGFGQVMRGFLKKPVFLRSFNITMAALTSGCVVFIWLD